MHLLLAGSSHLDYLEQIAPVLCDLFPEATLRTALHAEQVDHDLLLHDVVGITHLILFTENEAGLDALLRTVSEINPGLLIVTMGYLPSCGSRAGTLASMRNLRIELHIDLDRSGVETFFSVLSVQGDSLLNNAARVTEVTQAIADYFQGLRRLSFPLRKTPFPTDERESFRLRNLLLETEIPIGGHPGAFGVTRRYHRHEGVDLYGLPGDVVSAMEDGIVIAIRAFTGKAIGSAHWADTQCILVEGNSGVLNYGEIRVDGTLSVGSTVTRGQTLGTLATVLINSKGRPDTMLHLERYVRGTALPILEWPLGAAHPDSLIDPTVLLFEAARLS